MKIKNVSIWIWLLGTAVVGSAGLLALTKNKASSTVRLEIIKKGLYNKGGYYEVRGQIYNPRTVAARNVKLTFQLAEGSMGRDEKIKYLPKSKAIAEFDYLPAHGTVDFVAGADRALDEDRNFFSITNWSFLEGPAQP